MPDPKYAAVIFDMDGVIADSEPVYFEAFNAVLRPLGKELTLAVHAQAMGKSVEESWRTVAAGVGLEGDYQPLVDHYNAYLLKALAELHKTLPGVRELIAALQERKVPLAVASSSLPGWIEALLRGTGLTDAFQAVVSRVEVANGKPAPDIFLAAAARLEVPPQRCIAIEDTPPGLASAKAAGMFAVQVRSSSTPFPPQPHADLVLDSLLNFDLGLLDA